MQALTPLILTTFEVGATPIYQLKRQRHTKLNLPKNHKAGSGKARSAMQLYKSAEAVLLTITLHDPRPKIPHPHNRTTKLRATAACSNGVQRKAILPTDGEAERARGVSGRVVPGDGILPSWVQTGLGCP